MEDIKPATEDLMNEHGLLNRIMIVYDLCVEKRAHFAEVVVLTEIVKDFIENFHEKMEETYIFPAFKGSKYEELIELLIKQHRASADLTSSIVTQAKNNDAAVFDSITSFLKMYRLHSSREDTIVFRKYRKLVDTAELRRVSKLIDDLEDERYGKNGFDMLLGRVIVVEQLLGIYIG